ncbi:MAG: RNA polymerase sigma factor [Chloroflexota bacterium]|nr:RNA polymerase sigma factor [Chloroflexota bacterium]
MKVIEREDQTSEAELVQRLRDGDTAALHELYNAYRDKLYFLIYGRVDGNRAVADDLVQEIFLVALVSLDQFRGESSLYTWLRGIAYHKISDFYRRKALDYKHGVVAGDVSAYDDETDAGDTAHDRLEAAESRVFMRRALEGLPLHYRRVLVLKYVERMPVLRISQVMGKSAKSIEGLLSRARRSLRGSLTENV